MGEPKNSPNLKDFKMIQKTTIEKLQDAQKFLKDLAADLATVEIRISSKLSSAESAEKVTKELLKQRDALKLEISRGTGQAKQELKEEHERLVSKAANLEVFEKELKDKEQYIKELKINLEKKTEEYDNLIKAEVKSSKAKADPKPKASK